MDDLLTLATDPLAFTFVVLLVGLGVVAVPAGLVSAALSETRRLETRGAEPQPQREAESEGDTLA